MSRLTGKDALGLFEAYNAVYAPQEEISEEQVWEEVEEWVNSLVEEGYDLSEFTWEEMYEEYISEIPINPGGNSNAPYKSRFARPMNANTPQRTGRASAVSRPPIGGITGSTAKTYRGDELQQAARARASQVGTTRQGTAGGPTVGGNTPIGPSAKPAAAKPAATRPAATAAAAKPAPTAAAKPAAAKPAPTAAAPAAPKKTFNPLMNKTFGYQTGYAPDQIKNDPKKMAQTGSVKNISASFDMFDVVKAHLIDEGYADTEEAAVAIMANMSEDWKHYIMGEARDGYGADEKFKQDTDKDSFKPGTDVPKVKKFGRIFKNIPYGIGDHSTRTVSANSTARGRDPGAPRSQKIAKDDDKKPKKVSKEIIRHPKKED